MYNSVTITTKEKRLAYTDIEISMLLLHLIFLQNLLLFISSISVGRGKRDGERLPYSREASSLPIFKIKFCTQGEVADTVITYTKSLLSWLKGTDF